MKQFSFFRFEVKVEFVKLANCQKYLKRQKKLLYFPVTTYRWLITIVINVKSRVLVVTFPFD